MVTRSGSSLWPGESQRAPDAAAFPVDVGVTSSRFSCRAGGNPPPANNHRRPCLPRYQEVQTIQLQFCDTDAVKIAKRVCGLPKSELRPFIQGQKVTVYEAFLDDGQVQRAVPLGSSKAKAYEFGQLFSVTQSKGISFR